jgi:hypothetical protein
MGKGVWRRYDPEPIRLRMLGNHRLTETHTGWRHHLAHVNGPFLTQDRT